jgi:hypothetical protein
MEDDLRLITLLIIHMVVSDTELIRTLDYVSEKDHINYKLVISD